MDKKLFTYKFKTFTDSDKKVIICDTSFICGHIYYLTGRGKAICSPDDTYDEINGKKLALARAKKALIMRAITLLNKKNESLKRLIESNEKTKDSLLAMKSSVDSHLGNIIRNM